MACPNINSPEWKSLVEAIGENNAWKEFLKYGEVPSISKTKFLSIRTKTTEQIKKGVDPTLIQNEREIKYTSFILNELLTIIGKITPGKKLGISVDDAFDKVKDIYFDLLDSINMSLESFVKSDEDLQDIKNSESFETLKKEFRVLGWVNTYNDLIEARSTFSDIITNFSKYQDFVKVELAHKGIKIKKGKLEIIPQEDLLNEQEDKTDDNTLSNEEINPQKFDANIFQTNSRDTASIRVRTLVQTIKTGKFEFGIPLYADADDVMDDILFAGTSMNLSGYTDTNTKLEVFRTQLGLRQEGRPYIDDLLSKINEYQKEGDWEILNQILTFASKAFANQTILLYNLKKFGKEIVGVNKVKTIRSNSDTVEDQIKKDWLANHTTSDFFNRTANGDLFPNGKKVEKLNEIRLEGKNMKGDAQQRKFIEFFKELGVAFTEEEVKLIAPNINKALKKGEGFEYLFNDKSLLDRIYQNFKENITQSFEGQYGFQNESTSMTALAKLYYNVNPGKYKNASSTTADGKQNYLNIQLNHVEISKREYENGDGSVVTNTALAQPNLSFWTKVKNYTRKFVLGYFSGSREQEAGKEGKVRKNFTEKEQLVSMFLKHQENMNEGTYVTFTLSDKITSLETKMSKEFFIDTDNSIVGKGSEFIVKNNVVTYTPKFKDNVYNSFVEPEISRILASIKYGKDVNLENFDIASKLFYLFPSLNSAPILEKFREDLYAGSDINLLKQKYSKIVADVIIEEFNNSSEKQIDTFLQNGIIKQDDNGNYLFPVFKNIGENDYVNRFKKTELTNRELAKLMVMDMKFNYMNAQIKTIQFLKFDPMHAFKAFKGFNKTDFNQITGEEKVKLVNTTWDEFSKRAAALIAPGNQGNWSWLYGKGENEKKYNTNEYRTVTLKDIKKDINDYKGVETTDAQEFVTLQEHIDALMSEGKLPIDVWESIHKKIEDNGKGGYFELDPKELKYVFTPTKPVYAGNTNEGISTGLNRFNYIKTSRYPLIPEHEAGSERDKLRQWMEKNNIQSANFASGKKLGRPSLSLEAFDKNNNFIEPVDFEKSIQTLSRDGLRNQQEMPHQKDEISVVSQMNRTLFDGLLESTFNFSNMKNITGEQLKNIKEAIRSKMFYDKAKQLEDKLGNVLHSDQGLHDLLVDIIKNDTTGSYTENDLKSLELNKDGFFKMPLETQFKFKKYQSLVNSLINKNVMLKVDGTSFVQVSAVGSKFNFNDLSKGIKSGIIWTKSYASKFKNGETSLNYISKDAKGNVQPAQVIVSQYLRDDKGELIDLKEYITEENGIKILDTSKLSPKMFQLIASRIPNQSHVSTIPIEVVGFLPSYMENTIIVPDGITGQMGSDFDVDKLFVYTTKFKYTGKNSKERLGANLEEYDELITAAKKIAKAAGEKADKNGRYRHFNEYLAKAVKDKYGDNEVPKFKTENPTSIEQVEYEINSVDDIINLNEEQLGQAYRDIHWEVLTHKDTFDKITKSVDNPEVGDKIKNRDEQLEKYKIVNSKDFNLPLDYETSIKRHVDNKSGKAGVSIYANLISAQADLQDKTLRLGKIVDGEDKEEPIRIKLSKKSEKIIDLLYIGQTGSSKSFLDKIRSISDNLNIQFTESVDNAKNQRLREFNWDEKSMGAVGLLSMLTDKKGVAVPIEFMMDLTSQPAIKQLLTLMDLKQDSFGEYDSNAILTSVEELKKIISDTILKFNLLPVGVNPEIYLNENKEKRFLDPETLADMWLVGQTISQSKENRDISLEEIRKDLNTKYNETIYKSIDDLLLEYYTVQNDSLDLFYNLNDKGKELMTILGSVYTYTKGVGANLFVTKQKLNQLNKLAASNNFLDIKKLAGDVSKNKETGLIEILPNGEIGSSIDNSLIVAQKLYAKLFPIASGKHIESIVTKILENQGLKINEIGKEKYESIFEDVFKSAIHYIYTSPDLELFDNVKETRNTLINGDASLGKRVLNFKNQPEYAKNGFLKNIQVESLWKSKAYVISFKAPFGTDIDEKAVISGFYQLVTSDKEEVRQLAKDFALYTYATGDAGNIGRFIPVDYYLSDKDFRKGIRRIRSTFISNIDDDSLFNNFIDQIVQNNPEEYSKKFDFSSRQGQNGDNHSIFKQILKPLIGNQSSLVKIDKFQITLGNFLAHKKGAKLADNMQVPLSATEIEIAKRQGFDPYTIDKNKNQVPKSKYPPYILITDEYVSSSEIPDRKVKYLYKRTSPAFDEKGIATYERINILGIKGIKEFDFNNGNLKSVIDNNNVDVKDPIMLPEGFDTGGFELESNEKTSTKPVSTETAETIYNKLGDKTQSENVILPENLGLKYGGLYKSNMWTVVSPKFKKQYPNGIVAYRGKVDSLALGNPFSVINRGEDTVKQFIEWIITGNNFGVETILLGGKNYKLSDLRNEYINIIKKSKGEKILYYTELGRPSHATALDYLINKYDWNTSQTTTAKLVQSTNKIDNTNKPEFDKLPGKSVTPTMTYAGIGSRETPQEVLDVMTKAAEYLDGLGYTLQTGFTFKNKETGEDEEGADKAFSQGSKNKMLFGPSGIRKTSKGNMSLESYNDKITKTSGDIVKEIHPAPDRLTPGAVKLMARNTNQIFGKNLDSTVDFVLFYAKETDNPLRPKGGTGQAVEMARRKGIPTINMADTNWKQELVRVLSGAKQPAVSVVEITKSNYTREEVQNNPNTAYVFTENTHSITAFPDRQGGGSAIIRPEPNAFAIVTKKKYDYNTKENIDYSDTAEDFKEFTEVNTKLINELKNSGKSKIVFPQGFATDKAKMPTRFAEWLQKALLDNFGLVTELNSTKTGLISKSISQPTQAVSGVKPTKVIGKMSPKGYMVPIITVDYKGTGYIIEGSEEEGWQVYTTSAGKKSKLVSDNMLTSKVSITHEVSLYPERVVTLTNMQHSPSYYVTSIGEVLSLAPSNFSKQITSTDIVNKVLGKLDKLLEDKVIIEEKIIPIGESPIFSYKGISVKTEFKLSDEQTKALTNIIDFVEGSEVDTGLYTGTYTLEGYAGTGKTSIIGVLDKYTKEKNKHTEFIYMAPTHAATVVLGLNVVKYGSTKLPMTVQSAVHESKDRSGNKIVKFTKKFNDRAKGVKNVIIFDEAVMLEDKLFNYLLSAAKSEGHKVIFLGDPKQISEVASGSDNKQKILAKAFSNPSKSLLTEVFRTKDNNILSVLTKIRNNKEFEEQVFPSTDTIKRVKRSEYNDELIKNFTNSIEDTVIINYTNRGVAEANKHARRVLGFSGELQAGEKIVGYLGSQTKQIEKGHLANSVSYIVNEVNKLDSGEVVITCNSKLLRNLLKQGMSGFTDKVLFTYLQLSEQDSFDFNLTDEQIENNKEYLKKYLKQIHVLNTQYNGGKGMLHYLDYLKLVNGIRESLSNINTGEKYIYNPLTDKIELFSDRIHGKINPNLVIDKGVDFGYAITVHKSQGMTIPIVHFDVASLQVVRPIDIIRNGEKFNSEKNALYYVGMSRASQKLIVPVIEHSTGTADENYEQKDESEEFDLAGFITKNNTSGVLKQIFGNEDTVTNDSKTILNSVYVDATPLNKNLLQLIGKTGGVGDIIFKIDKSLKNPGEYDLSTKTISINPDLIAYDIENIKESIHEVIMHELLHHVTANLLIANPATLTVEQRKWVVSLNNLFKSTQSKLLNDPIHKEALQNAIDTVAKSGGYLSQTDKSMYYGLTSVHDFVSMLMTDGGFREFMNNTSFDGTKSIIERFIEILTNILRSLGVVNNDSVLYEGVSNIVGLVNSRLETESNTENIQKSIATKSGSYNLVKDNLENLLDILNIKKYC